MNPRRPRIAILGGTGFLGRNVSEALRESGSEVILFSRTSGCDLLDLPKAWTALSSFRPHYLVNCAAFVGSVNFVTDFAADVVDINMRMLLNLYKIAQQLREAIVVNPVANCAYPGIMDFYEEKKLWDGPPHPSVLSYGSTRRMMIVLSQCYASQYGVRSINVMVPNMYGPYDSTNPNKTHALNALIIKFVRAVKLGLSEIEVWGTGEPIREWLYVRDCAAVIRRIIEIRNHNFEIVNIAQNRGHNVKDLVALLKELTSYDRRIVYNSRFPDGAPRKVMDDCLFRKRFPDFAFTSMKEGISQTIAYYTQIL